MNEDNFGLGDVKPDSNDIPNGEYTLAVIKAELKDTKTGTGKFVNTHFRVQELGATFFEKFNIKNESPKAEEIGRKQFKSFLLALGMTESQIAVFGPHKLYELEGCECRARLKTEDSAQWGPQTHVTVWKSKNFATAPATGAAPQAATTAAPAAKTGSPF